MEIKITAASVQPTHGFRFLNSLIGRAGQYRMASKNSIVMALSSFLYNRINPRTHEQEQRLGYKLPHQRLQWNMSLFFQD